ncbi:unnamed protein product [Ectocarpus sp. CCAP 1310/34]|nr:unnamed protein product [Ectocarpus sp. CCAP 1310/34]
MNIPHPHSHHVWAEPEPSSSSAHDGLAAGVVPLRVTLEGERANRFLLDVSSSIEEGECVGAGGSCGEAGGGADRHVDSSHADQGRQCAPSKGLTLDLSTGMAHGWVAVLPASRPTEPRTPPDLDHDDSTPVCACPAVAAQRRRRRRRRQARAAAAGEENGCEPEGEDGVVAGAEVQLSISLSPAWVRRFNRPVLPLESLPAFVHDPAYHVAAVGATPTVATPTPPTGRLEGEGQRRAVIGRRDACNVRRLRFEVGVARGGGDRDTGRRTPGEEERREEKSGSKFTPNEAEGATVEDSHLAEAPSRKHKGGYCRGPRNTSLPPPPSPPATPAWSRPSLSSSPVGNAPAMSGSEWDGATGGLSSCSASSGSGSGSGSGSTACDDDDDDENDDKHGNKIVEVCAAESASLGGFFGTVWDCSLKMGAFLAALGPGSLEGKRVVELGAATGTLSALCAALGASEVVATDTKDLLPLLTFNLARNSCPGSVNVEACEYDWGSPVGHHLALSQGGGFDVVLCSDLLYDPAGWEPLLESLRQLLAAAGERQRQPTRRRGAAGAGSSPTPPPAPAVVYLAHRTRNPQESEFFDVLLGQEGGRGPAAEASQRGGPREGCEEGVLSFRCRRLSDEWVGGCHDEGCRGGEGLVWRGGCFPDIALYELSPVFAR